MMGRHQPPPPHYPPHFRPLRRPRRCSRRETWARVHWRRTMQRHRHRVAVTPSRTCRCRCSGPERGGWGSDAPCRPCDAHSAPACKSCRGHRGVRHCCSRHHEGHPRLVPAAGGARQRTLFGLGGRCPPPPPVRGGDDDNGEGASQGSGIAMAPTGRSGIPRRGHGRAEGADT